MMRICNFFFLALAVIAPLRLSGAQSADPSPRPFAVRQPAITRCRAFRASFIRRAALQVAPLARRRGLAPRQTRAFLHALARKLRSRLRCRALLRRHPRLNRRILRAWLQARVSPAAMMRVLDDAAANFALLEKEPPGGEPGKLPAPRSVRLNIYPPAAQARADLARALRLAPRENKRILLDFGGNWCYDCHVLDHAFRHSRLTPLLRRHFLVVHVNVGTFNVNRALARRYGVVLKKGVPALSVLSCRGRLLYGQKLGQFENARALTPAAVERFLRQWSSPDCAQ